MNYTETTGAGSTFRPETTETLELKASIEKRNTLGDPVVSCSQNDFDKTINTETTSAGSLSPEPIKTIEKSDTSEDFIDRVFKTTTIRISLFFDGTGNNKMNTTHRENDDNCYKEHKGEKSYENDYTNIYYLQKYLTTKTNAEHSDSIYIEGIGTVNSGKDNTYGMASGEGDTGIIKMTENGREELINLINNFRITKGTIIKSVDIDTFGFSRGAAAARYFVYAALPKDDPKPEPLWSRLSKEGYNVLSVNVKFVGLYDTVASHGLRHGDDTEDLHLDAISAAESVVQLAAADEHRANFRLTNINSAGDKGRQYFLPGAHSDIGGGYTENESESDYPIWKDDEKYKKEVDWIISSGWYKRHEIGKVKNENDPLSGEGSSCQPAITNNLIVNRINIKNTYSRIPLHKMAKFAEESGLNFEDALYEDHAIPEELKQIKELINKYISSCACNNKVSTFSDWWNNYSPGYIPEDNIDWMDYQTKNKAIQDFKHNFLHFSANYYKDEVLGIITINAPNYKKGERKRVIQDG